MPRWLPPRRVGGEPTVSRPMLVANQPSSVVSQHSELVRWLGARPSTRTAARIGATIARRARCACAARPVFARGGHVGWLVGKRDGAGDAGGVGDAVAEHAMPMVGQ